MVPAAEACATCHYFRADDDQGRQGDCRRKPPVMIVVPIDPHPQGVVERNIGFVPPRVQVVTAFPKVGGDTWCGEWATRRVPRGDA